MVISIFIDAGAGGGWVGHIHQKYFKDAASVRRCCLVWFHCFTVAFQWLWNRSRCVFGPWQWGRSKANLERSNLFLFFIIFISPLFKKAPSTSNRSSADVQEAGGFKDEELPPVPRVNFNHQGGAGGAHYIRRVICILIPFVHLGSVFTAENSQLARPNRV